MYATLRTREGAQRPNDRVSFPDAMRPRGPIARGGGASLE